MNGDHKILLDKLETMEEKQDQRHEENLKTFGKLPCGTHAFMINTLWAIFLGGFVITMLAIIVRKVVAG